MPTDVLVLDDLATALRLMSPLGQSLLAPMAVSITNELRTHGERMGWVMIEHDDFSKWVDTRLKGVRRIILDPLLPVGDNGVRVSATRYFAGQGWKCAAVLPRTRLDGGQFALVDDAIATGDTMIEAVNKIGHRGGRITTLMTCAASTSAIGRLAESVPDAKVETFVEGNHYVIHARDACPFMPNSGRPFTVSPVNVYGAELPVRFPPFAFQGGPWSQLRQGHFLNSLSTASRLFLERFRATIGRDPLIADLSLLGTQIPISCFRPAKNLSARTPLSSLI